MKTTTYILGFVVITIFSFWGCKKKSEDNLPPAINFKVGNEYTKNNDTVDVGHRLYFGIQARGTSGNITNFTVKKTLENGTVVTMMDSGLNAQSIDISKVFYQNVENKAVWTFTVMDRNRMMSQVSLVVYKDPNSAFGGIYYYPSIKMGYQNNTTYNHFLNPLSGLVYTVDSANVHGNLIDVLIYYINNANSNNLPSPILSSPGEMDNSSTEAQTFYPYIANWNPRNYTLWDISFDNGNNAPLTVADFNAAQNDSLLIVSYHPVWGKKKFRWATAGKIIPFLTAGGKLGLVYVARADSADTGIMELAVKIQQ
jgi:hypothetical protein